VKQCVGGGVREVHMSPHCISEYPELRLISEQVLGRGAVLPGAGSEATPLPTHILTRHHTSGGGGGGGAPTERYCLFSAACITGSNDSYATLAGEKL